MTYSDDILHERLGCPERSRSRVAGVLSLRLPLGPHSSSSKLPTPRGQRGGVRISSREGYK
eukprot:5713087-Heterocapsa_arctica.AAC.1